MLGMLLRLPVPPPVDRRIEPARPRGGRPAPGCPVRLAADRTPRPIAPGFDPAVGTLRFPRRRRLFHRIEQSLHLFLQGRAGRRGQLGPPLRLTFPTPLRLRLLPALAWTDVVSPAGSALAVLGRFSCRSLTGRFPG